LERSLVFLPFRTAYGEGHTKPVYTVPHRKEPPAFCQEKTGMLLSLTQTAKLRNVKTTHKDLLIHIV
jgi:hypothetical protein